MTEIMNTRVFLASSINDFAKERREVGAFIQELNQQRYIKEGKYIKLYLCEDMSDCIASEKKRKQEEYNEAIRKSNLFILMADHKVGKYTMEELQVAEKQYSESGYPCICIFIKKRKGEGLSEEIMQLKELADTKHYLCEIFEDINIVKKEIEGKLEEEICT